MTTTSEREVIEVVADEPSRMHHMAPTPPPGVGEHLWKWALLAVTTITAAVVLADGLGRLRYVTRSEYAEDAKVEAVTRENMRGTLERLDKTIAAQAAAFERLTGEMQTVKVDLAITKKNR